MFIPLAAYLLQKERGIQKGQGGGGGGGARVFQPWRKLWDTGNQNSNNFIDKYMVLRWVKPHPITSGLTPSSNVAGLFDIIMET